MSEDDLVNLRGHLPNTTHLSVWDAGVDNSRPPDDAWLFGAKKRDGMVARGCAAGTDVDAAAMCSGEAVEKPEAGMELTGLLGAHQYRPKHRPKPPFLSKYHYDVGNPPPSLMEAGLQSDSWEKIDANLRRWVNRHLDITSVAKLVAKIERVAAGGALPALKQRSQHVQATSLQQHSTLQQHGNTLALAGLTGDKAAACKAVAELAAEKARFIAEVQADIRRETIYAGMFPAKWRRERVKLGIDSLTMPTCLWRLSQGKGG